MYRVRDTGVLVLYPDLHPGLLATRVLGGEYFVKGVGM